MGTYSIGRVRPNRRGDWSSSTEYKLLDMVKYEYQWWIASKDVPKGTIPSISQYWDLFGARGEPGPKGEKGLTGNSVTKAVVTDNGHLILTIG